MEPLVPAGPGEMGLGESISHLMGREGSFDEKIDAARFHKEKGNALLNSGDYEDALRMYEAGLKLVTFHERAMAMVKLLATKVSDQFRYAPESHLQSQLQNLIRRLSYRIFDSANVINCISYY